MKPYLAAAVLASLGLHKLQIPTCALLPTPPEFEAVDAFLRAQGEAPRVPEPSTGGVWVLERRVGDALGRGPGSRSEEIFITFEARHEPALREARGFVQVVFYVAEAKGAWSVRDHRVVRDPVFNELALGGAACPRHRFVAVRSDASCPLER